jgi:hypothetical protein
MPKVDFREEVANVALAELLEQRGLSEGRYVANVSLPKMLSVASAFKISDQPGANPATGQCYMPQDWRNNNSPATAWNSSS